MDSDGKLVVPDDQSIEQLTQILVYASQGFTTTQAATIPSVASSSSSSGPTLKFFPFLKVSLKTLQEYLELEASIKQSNRNLKKAEQTLKMNCIIDGSIKLEEHQGIEIDSQLVDACYFVFEKYNYQLHCFNSFRPSVKKKITYYALC